MNSEEKKKTLKELGDIPEELYDELVAEFKTQFNRQMEEIQKALASNNLTAVRESAHSLSGTSGNLRIYSVHHAAKALELSLKQAEPLESVKQNFNTLEGIFLENWK